MQAVAQRFRGGVPDRIVRAVHEAPDHSSRVYVPYWMPPTEGLGSLLRTSGGAVDAGGLVGRPPGEE